MQSIPGRFLFFQPSERVILSNFRCCFSVYLAISLNVKQSPSRIHSCKLRPNVRNPWCRLSRWSTGPPPCMRAFSCTCTRSNGLCRHCEWQNSVLFRIFVWRILQYFNNAFTRSGVHYLLRQRSGCPFWCHGHSLRLQPVKHGKT